MNTYPSKKTDAGWIICPSKTFRGKFYYFNVSTGETAWCLNENESKSLKDPRLQRVDHGYPEPNSPPTEEIQTGSNYQQPFVTPNYERTISNYPINMYQNTAQNVNPVLMQPFDQFTNSVPRQIQYPMIWPIDSNSPQLVMIVMNQALRQLAIDETRQAFRQPNYALEPNRAWKEPSQGPEPYHVFEPNQAWVEPSHAWKGLNHSPMEPKEPDRGLLVHTGKMPLCKRFTNFPKPASEVKENKTVFENKYDLSTKNEWELSTNNQCGFSTKNQNDVFTNKSYGPTFNSNQSIDSPETSMLKLNQNQPKTLLCEEMEKMQNPVKIESDCSVVLPNASNSDFSQSAEQNLPKLDQGLFRQSQRNNDWFGQTQQHKEFLGQSQTKSLIGESQTKKFQTFEQSQTNEGLFGQSQTKQLFGQSQTNKELFGPSQTKQLFGQSQTNKQLFGQSNTNKELFRQDLLKHKIFGQKGVFGQRQMNNNLYEQSQTKQLFTTSQPCSEIFPDLESNSFKKLITEKSTLKQSRKVDFLKSRESVDIPSNFEEKQDKNAKENSALTLNHKAEISQETGLQNLDKNDLRRILMEKKRKSNVLETTNIIEAKKIKTIKKATATVPKKKVTFNLEPENFTISEYGDNASYKRTERQGLSPPNGESWYVVTDSTTLLEDFNVLDNFVKSDPKCNLMIPSGVMSDIVALSRGECRERGLVTLARHFLRGLATPQPHIIVQESADMSLDISTEDSILNCCLEVADNAYVVLITKDEDLQTTAEYLSINCFTSDQIKNSQAQQPEVHFDVKKVKISITNEPDIDIPTKKFESLSFGTGNLNLDRNKSSKNFFEYNNSKTVKPSESELHHRAKGDYKNSKTGTQALEIQKNARDYSELDTTTLNKRVMVPNLNKTTEQTETAKEANPPQCMPSCSRNKKTEESISSIFKQANDKIKNKSIFEIDRDKTISKKGSIFEIDGNEKQPQKLFNLSIVNSKESRDSIFKRDWPPINQTQNSISEKHENKCAPSKSFVFEKENVTNKAKQSTTYKNTVNQSDSSIFDNQRNPSIFGTETRANQPKQISEKENFALKNKYLEEFLKRFCEKNERIKHLAEERREEIGCSFEQIMEDCLNNVLQNKTNVLQQKLGSSPPWTLTEALQCMTFVYDTHTYIQDVVSVFTSVLKSKCVTAKDIFTTIGCGVALVKYLMFLTPTTDILKDTEDALGTILQNLTVDTDIEPKAPSYPSHISCVEQNKPTTVKDRSDVVKYLKKHFKAWAEYDETLEEFSEAMGKNDKHPMILRTCGKHLGSLKLNYSKSMTLEPDSSRNIDKTKNSQNRQENLPTENYKTECGNMDVENVILNEDLDKNNLIDRKLTRTVKNATAKALQDNNFQVNSTEENKKKKQTEPKVVRLFSNIDFNEGKKPKNAPEKLVLDDFSTHGHTFGSMQSGPKIMRKMKPIKEFEEKFTDKKPLDLDDISYSIISKSDENNNLAIEGTNNSCLSMSLENNNDSNQNTYLDAINDHPDGKNDCNANNDRFDARNDSRNIDSNHNNTATNNENHKVVLKKCTTNNIYGAIDIDDILTTNDVVHSTYYNNFDSEFTHNNYETNDNFVIDTINDGFKRLSYGNKLNDGMDDMMPKDDATNDSGIENASQTAYYVMDTFLSDLKLAFKAMHKFLENSVHELRSDELSASTCRIISDTATKTLATLDKIVANLGGIIHRETYGGTKLKDLVASAGSNKVNDERIENYREIVTKCYDHAMLIDNGLRAMLALNDA